MNVGYGGAGGKLMHDSLISQKDGFLGYFPSMLNVGDTQSFVFKESDDWPFWMTPEKRIKSKFDIKLGKTRPQAKNQNELKQEMLAINSEL
eukprot:5797530-Ditylum_brightwellii.AAC.1